ncbi:hypothetical protein HanIR_Chr01g0003691 [Helianthus annuus]|nr:hypothetical protein HanIR_Chr01g0003691 [Helianthus annuus]
MSTFGVQLKVAREQLVQIIPVGTNIDEVTCLHHFLHRFSKIKVRVRRDRRDRHAATHALKPISAGIFRRRERRRSNGRC